MADNKLTISTIPISKLTVILNDFIAKTVNHLNKLSINVEEKFENFDSKLNDLEIMTTLLESKLDSLPSDITSQYPALQQCSLDDVNPVINISQNIQNPPQSSSVPSNNIPSVPGNVPPVPGNIPPVPGTGSIPPVPGTGSVPSVPPVPVPGTVPSVPVPSVPIPVPIPNPNANNATLPNPNDNNNNQVEGGEAAGAEEPKELTPQEEFEKFMSEHNNDTFNNLAKMLKLRIPEMALQQKARMNGLNMDDVNKLIELWKKFHPDY